MPDITLQAPWGYQPKTLTVGELRDLLIGVPADMPVVFQTPRFGCFGPETEYTIQAVTATFLPERSETTPACTTIDDETGEEISVDEHTLVWPAWSGVIIT